MYIFICYCRKFVRRFSYEGEGCLNILTPHSSNVRNAPCTRPKFELMNCILTTWHCLLDKNECLEQRGGCQHACVNTEGSFKCSCKTGFKLHSNGKDCVGMSAILFTFTILRVYVGCVIITGGMQAIWENSCILCLKVTKHVHTKKLIWRLFKNYLTLMPER